MIFNKSLLILGASGMLGSTLFRYFRNQEVFKVTGVSRNPISASNMQESVHVNLISGIDVENTNAMIRLLNDYRPDVVINCVGIVKQRNDANNPLTVLPINTLLPHRLASLCGLLNARLIHFSTDCVFDGTKGMYTEDDIPNAHDLYGRSKLLGEVDYPHTVTLRTSLIGHELVGARSLICWFLAQEGRINGYTHAIFSGLPTVEIARLICDYILPNPQLSGIYHVAADPIDKFSLLTLVASTYGKIIEIIPNNQVVIDRSLDSSRFRAATGYNPPAWPELIKAMYAFK